MGLSAARATPGVTARAAVVVAVALVTVASLGVLAWQRLAGAEPAFSATVGGLTAEVQQAGWVGFDHGHVMDLDGGSGFMMPDQMVPGAPSMAGDEARLGITLTLVNTDSRAHEFNLAEEFSVTGGGTTGSRPPVADTFGGVARLAPGAAVSGTLYFDVAAPQADDPPRHLVWQRQGRGARLALPDQGEVPEHPH